MGVECNHQFLYSLWDIKNKKYVTVEDCPFCKIEKLEEVINLLSLKSLKLSYKISTPTPSGTGPRMNIV